MGNNVEIVPSLQVLELIQILSHTAVIKRLDIIHTVSVQTQQISGIHFMKTRRRTSRKTKTHIHLNNSSLRMRASHGLH